MYIDVQAHCGTVFLSTTFDNVDKDKLKKDYHDCYHSKRPPVPKTIDSMFFVTVGLDEENLNQLRLVNELVKKPTLRAVNFILLDDPNLDPTTDELAQLKSFMKEWDGHFKKNSYNGSLTMSICTQNFSAMLLEGYQVRGINRLALGL